VNGAAPESARPPSGADENLNGHRSFYLMPVGATPFLVAALVRDPALLHVLLDAGADPSTAAEGGFTPLMAAAGMDAERYRAAGPRQRPSEDQVLDSVGFVLDHGADVNAVDAAGQTALHAAAAARSADVVELLLKHGERADLKDRDGRTPLDIARRERATSVVELLK
jgi:uncharacterized protein